MSAGGCLQVWHEVKEITPGTKEHEEEFGTRWTMGGGATTYGKRTTPAAASELTSQHALCSGGVPLPDYTHTCARPPEHCAWVPSGSNARMGGTPSK